MIPTHKLVDIPASMLASFLCFNHALVHAKMPVHMSSLLFLAFFVILKASSTLSTGSTKSFIEHADEMWSGTAHVRILSQKGIGQRTYILREAGLSCTSLGRAAIPVHRVGWFGICEVGSGGGYTPENLPGRGI